MKRTAFAIVATCAAAAQAAVTVNTWNNSVENGEWAEADNWNMTTFYPIGVSHAAGFSAKSDHSGTVVTNHLLNAASKLNHVYVLHYAPSSYVFDGEGRVFEMAARDAEDTVRGTQDESGASFYPFNIMSESSSSSSALKISKILSNNREAVFSWSNALMRTYSPERKMVGVEFLRGLFDFNPYGKNAWSMFFSDCKLARCDMVVSNATLKACQLTAYGTATNNSMTVRSGGSIVVNDQAQIFYGGDYAYPGTNVMTVVGGGSFVYDNGGEKQNARTIYLGTEKSAESRRNEFSFSGVGTMLNLGQVGSTYLGGNTRFEISDGATAVVPGRFGLGLTSPDSVKTYECLMEISGDDTAVYMMTNVSTATAGAGYFYVGYNSYASNRVVMTGGRVKPLYPSGTGGISMRIASGAASNGTFEMDGGELDVIVTNCPNRSTTCTIVMGPGNALFDMSGGKVVCGDFNVGANQGSTPEKTITHVQRLRMTGGELDCGRLYLGSSESQAPNSTFQYQEAHVDLDGGVLKTQQANVFSSALKGEGYYAKGYLTANGGTIKAKSNGTDLLSNFWTAELGPKGLTIDASDVANVRVTQSFSDKAGEEGLLVFANGSSTVLTYSPDRYCTVSRTVVDRGTLAFNSGDVEMLTELVLTNGAYLSMVGTVTNLVLKALSVPKGTILVDPDDSVHLKTPNIDVAGLTIKFQSPPAYDQAYGVFTFDGDVTANDAVRKALRKITLYDTYTGRHGAFALSYDDTSGKTTMTLTVKEDSAPYSDKTVWNGPAWNNGGWSAGVPTSTNVASFSNASAPTAVPVAAGAEVGAMELVSGEDYTFTGDSLDFSGDQGGVFLDVTSGNHEFNLPINLVYSLPITLSPGTSVSFNETVADGSITKTGKGALTLAAANDFKSGVSLGGGLNTVAHEDALSCAAGDTYVTDDTIVFTNSVEDAEMRISTPVVLASETSASNAVIVKADSDVVFDDLSVSAGALIKRGRGKMTIMASSDKTTVLRSGHGVGKAANKQVNSSTILSFAADGSAPDMSLSQYAGFNVAEGELVIKGDASSKQVDLKTPLLVGMYLSGDASTFAQPVLTIDGADILTARDSNHGVIGYRSASSGCAVKRSTLRVINGGKIRFATLHLGDTANNTGSYQLVALTNGTVRCENSIRCNTAGQAASKMGVVLQMKDSTFCTTATGGSQFGIYLNGTIVGDIDNSFFGGLNEPVKLQLYGKYLTGELYVRNGSVFAVRNGYISEKTTSALPDFTLAFNDAEWRWGGDDMTITTNNVVGWGFFSDKHHVEMRGTGVVFKPDSGNTLTIAMPFEGAGGLVCDGAGTVKFMRDSWSFGGLLDIRSGTVDLTESDAKPTATVRGPGTLKGGSFGTLVLSEPFGTSCAPALDGVTATRVRVDLGADESSPLNLDDLTDLTVATYVGAAPSVGGWRVTGTGISNVRGEFSAADGTVKMTVVKTGNLLIIR